MKHSAHDLNDRNTSGFHFTFYSASFMVAAFIGLTLFPSCGGPEKVTRKLVEVSDAGSLDKESPYLKAHLRDGRVYVLSKWVADDGKRLVSGVGRVLDINRLTVMEGELTLFIDSVALFETNVLQASRSVTALSVVSALSAALSVVCITNPKTCFGSCPTFYVTDGHSDILQAEGFSSSVLPSLEKQDVDALFRANPRSSHLKIEMKNEALETHIVRYANILATRRAPGHRVFATSSGEFWEASELQNPLRCRGEEGDCTEKLIAMDGVERFSLADSTDLAKRENVKIDFPNATEGDYGVVIAGRQSLMSTFLFYQTLSYMGSSAGKILASVESGGAEMRSGFDKVNDLLGGISVSVKNPDGSLSKVEDIFETGPLATDVHLVRLPHVAAGPVTIQLSAAYGAWRFDWVALVKLGKRVEPIRLEPDEVWHNGKPDEQAKRALCEAQSPLVTTMGDEYSLVYTLPDDYESYEYFLETKGYYLEWMRKEWLVEENPMRLALLYLFPEKAVKVMAPEFKKVEAEFERVFWSSRYAKQE